MARYRLLGRLYPGLIVVAWATSGTVAAQAPEYLLLRDQKVTTADGVKLSVSVFSPVNPRKRLPHPQLQPYGLDQV
jgi:hypothetical protein